MHGGGNL
jgi:hypothetical protein